MGSNTTSTSDNLSQIYLSLCELNIHFLFEIWDFSSIHDELGVLSQRILNNFLLFQHFRSGDIPPEVCCDTSKKFCWHSSWNSVRIPSDVSLSFFFQASLQWYLQKIFLGFLHELLLGFLRKFVLVFLQVSFQGVLQKLI